MELTKNIFFNTDKLIENSVVKISYTGKLFQDASEKVSIHYGFGNNWDNVNDIERKEDIIFEDKPYNIWDNNECQNYIFPLEKVQTELVVLEDEPMALGTAKKLRKSYLWNKKIRLAVYKIITYLPKLISGNYKRKLLNN